jgi:hypothetical protein
MELFTELRENPTDINAVVARRRKDFTGEFFRNLNYLVNAYNGLDERDGKFLPSHFLTHKLHLFNTLLLFEYRSNQPLTYTYNVKGYRNRPSKSDLCLS